MKNRFCRNKLHEKQHWCTRFLHKEKTDEINLKNVANVFCEANEERRHTFGMFCDEEFSKLKLELFFKKTTCER